MITVMSCILIAGALVEIRNDHLPNVTRKLYSTLLDYTDKSKEFWQ
jgi:hypothetical protein